MHPGPQVILFKVWGPRVWRSKEEVGENQEYLPVALMVTLYYNIHRNEHIIT